MDIFKNCCCDIYVVDDQLNCIPYLDWNQSNNDHARYVKVITQSMLNSTTNNQCGLYISKDWQNQFLQKVQFASETHHYNYLQCDNNPEFDFNGAHNCQIISYEIEKCGYAQSEALQLVNSLSEIINGQVVKFYIPSAGQFNAIQDNIDRINEALIFIGSNPIELSFQTWMTSSQYNESDMWCMYQNGFFALDKTTRANILPLADLYPEKYDPNIYVIDDNGNEFPYQFWSNLNNMYARYIKIDIEGSCPIIISTNYVDYLNSQSANYNTDFSKYDVCSSYDGYADFKSLIDVTSDLPQNLAESMNKCNETFLCSVAKAYLPTYDQLDHIRKNIDQIDKVFMLINGFSFKSVFMSSNFLCTANVNNFPVLYVYENNAEINNYQSLVLHDFSDIDTEVKISIIDTEGKEANVEEWDYSRSDAEFVKVDSYKLPHPMYLKKSFIYMKPHYNWQIEDKNIPNLPNVPNLQDAELLFDGHLNCMNAFNSMLEKNHQEFTILDTYNNAHNTSISKRNYAYGLQIDTDEHYYCASIGQIKLLFLNAVKINEVLDKIGSTQNLFSYNKHENSIVSSSTPAGIDKYWGMANNHIYKMKKSGIANPLIVFDYCMNFNQEIIDK